MVSLVVLISHIFLQYVLCLSLLCFLWQYTFILTSSKNLPKQCTNYAPGNAKYAPMKSIGVRMPDDPVTKAILENLDSPLISTRFVRMYYSSFRIMSDELRHWFIHITQSQSWVLHILIYVLILCAVSRPQKKMSGFWILLWSPMCMEKRYDFLYMIYIPGLSNTFVISVHPSEVALFSFWDIYLYAYFYPQTQSLFLSHLTLFFDLLFHQPTKTLYCRSLHL